MTAQQIFIEQRSDEWKELRRTKIGASHAAALCGKNPYETAHSVYEEMVLGKIPYINDAMRRGSELEFEAREWYNRQNLTAYAPAVFINDDYPYMLASLDGWDAENRSILEIKVPGEKVFIECQDGLIPEYWRYQVQQQFLVCEATSVMLLIWKNDNEFALYCLNPNPKMQEEIRIACEKFHNDHLLEFLPPTSKYKKRTDDTWSIKCSKWLGSKADRVLAEKYEKECYNDLLVESDGLPTTGCGVRVEKSEVKGKVDYSLIDVLKEMDLEPYRKPATIRWRICETDKEN